MFRGMSIIYRHKAQLVLILTLLTILFITFNFLRIDHDQPLTMININAHTFDKKLIRDDGEVISHPKIPIPKRHNDLINEIILNPKSDLTKKQHLQPEIRTVEVKPPPSMGINFPNYQLPIQQLQELPRSGDPLVIDNPDQFKDAEAELKKLQRVVHVDLKGAVPRIEYFGPFFRMLKDFGATGVLLEYEDVFPFTGRLAEAVHGQAFSLKDIAYIKDQAAANGLYIIPLVQTYGHLEWVLKLKNFSHLRDHSDYPQVITPCLDESYELIFDMLDQVIGQHPDAPYFHVGLDEVYYKLVHANCSQTEFQGDFTKAFLSHLTRVAAHVRQRLPKAKVLIWDDMLHSMDEFTMETFKPDILKYEIEPMIWAYMEDVKNWFQPYLYIKYGHIFKQVWAASAYKGASGELTTVTSIKHHYLNHLSWIDVIIDKHRNKIVNFRGICITGWTRYDHFLQLCDLLPQAIPSLVFSLQTVQFGRISAESKYTIGKRLGCSTDIPWTPDEIYYSSIQCSFPGHEVYEAILPIVNLVKGVTEDMEFARKYLTPIHLNYNYLHKQRAHECLQKLSGDYYQLVQFRNRFVTAARTMYSNETIDEWLAVYVEPHLDPVYEMIKSVKAQIATSDWRPRPQKIVAKKYPDYV